MGSRPEAIGRTLQIGRDIVTVVGVLRPEMEFGNLAEADLWLPLNLQQALGYTNNASSYDGADRAGPWAAEDRIAWLNLIARIPQDRLPTATARLTAGNVLGLQDMTASFADPRVRRDLLTHTLGIQPLSRGFSGLRAEYSDALLALGGIVAVLLLVTCANLASLMLARAAGRARDVAIRLSLGASSGRLVRQYLTESALLSCAGGAIGLLTGTWASSALAHQVLGTSRALPSVFSPDTRLVLFAAAASAASAILFGLAPALRAVAAGRSASLTANERNPMGRAGVAGMRPLVATQLGLAVVVVFAAALLGRTLVNYVRIDPGFDLDRVVSTAFDAKANGYAGSDVPALASRILTAVERVPGVRVAAFSACGLVANCNSSSGVRFDGQDAPASAQDNWVGPRYFTTVGIPLIEGREFEDRDTATSPRVAIVSESMARRYFGMGSASGRRLGFSALDTEIVGVVRDARSITLHAPPVPMVYFPLTQPAGTEAPGNLDVRVDGPADVAAAAIGGAMRAAAPGLTFDTVGPMRARVERDVARERLVAFLATAFALLTLFLSSLGLYGVLSYAVTRRTAEIGIRMALGAGTRQVAGLVLKDAARVVLAGALLGLFAAFGAGRLLRRLLFDVSAADPATAALAVAVLVTVSLAAAYLPVRRASRVDPNTALRTE
jgi:predicted permease